MIKSLSIQDFQSHKDSRFDFSSGINTIVGSSDKGKSAVLRSFCWTIWGRPAGTGIIRRGSKTCSAEIVTTDDHVVRKSRGPSLNSYEVDGKTYAAVGKAVPDEVGDVLPLTEINVQRQFDAPFLVFDTPGTVAATLNKFTGLHLAEQVIDLLSDQMVQTKRTVAAETAAVVECKARLAGLDWVDDYKVLVEQWEGIVAKWRKDEVLCDRLQQLIKTAQELSGKEKQLQSSVALMRGFVKDAGKMLQELCDANDELAETQTTSSGLRRLITSYKTAEDKITTSDSEVSRLSQEIRRLTDLEEQLAAKLQDYETANRAKETDRLTRSRLQRSITDLMDKEVRVGSAMNSVRSLRVELKKLSDELLCNLKECPTCGQHLDDKSRDLVLQYLDSRGAV